MRAPTPVPPGSTPRERRGFTLLEVLIVLAVLVLLAGAAIPLASKARTSAARCATREELVRIGVAAQEYFRDTHAVPGAIPDLELRGDSSGWDGPYLAALPRDPSAGEPEVSHATDAWSRPYRVRVAADLMTVASAGPDAAFDTADDVRIRIDFTSIRREETREELAAIQRSVALYEELHGADEPLPAAWDAALDRLVATELLPERDAFRSDAWGQAYVCLLADARSPTARVVSTSLATASARGAHADPDAEPRSRAGTAPGSGDEDGTPTRD